ncbi:MAG: tetratricopeptide repeat protein [Promethearchaeota archaeon]
MAPPDDELVVVDFEVFQQIYTASKDYGDFSIPKENWREVYGFLFGKLDREKNVLHVRVAEMTKVGEAIAVEFKDDDYLKAAEIESKYFDEGLFMVGWWHTHPGMGCFLSGIDKENQLQQTANEHYVALVYDFTRLTPDHPGFEIFKLTNPGIGVDSEFYKVNWKFNKANIKTLKRISRLLDPYVSVEERLKARETDVLKKEEHRVSFHSQKDAKGEVLVKQAHNLAREGNFDGAIQHIANALPILEKSDEKELYLNALCELADIYQEMGQYGEAVQAGTKVKETLESGGMEDLFFAGYADLAIGRAMWRLGRQFAKQAYDHLKDSTEKLNLASYPAGVARAFWELGELMASWGKTYDAVKFLGHAMKNFNRALTFDSSLKRLGEDEDFFRAKIKELQVSSKRYFDKLPEDQQVQVRMLYTQLGLINKPNIDDLYGVHF